MQAVREQKIEYRGKEGTAAKERLFRLVFLLGDGLLERNGSGGFRLQNGTALLISEEGNYVLYAEEAAVITFSMREFRDMPLAGENMASILPLIKAERGTDPTVVYFRDLNDGLITRALGLVEECAAKKRFSESVAVYELAGLLLRMTRYIWRTVTLRQESDLERTRKMLNYMLARFRDVTLEEMAEVFSYHPNTAAALLKKNTGKTFSELLLEIRMARVAEALRGGMSVSEAASACGYGNMSNFYRRFKQYYGITPTAFLNAAAEKEGSC